MFPLYVLQTLKKQQSLGLPLDWKELILQFSVLCFFYLHLTSYTPCRPVSPCSPVPATPGRSSFRRHPRGERWNLWRWDLCPRSPASQTSWNQYLYRCQNMPGRRQKQRKTDQQNWPTKLVTVSDTVFYPLYLLYYSLISFNISS